MGKASRRKALNRSQGVLGKATDVLQQISGTSEIRVRRNLPQEEKISHALMTLLKAEVPEGSPLAEYKAALNFIVLAWNISLLDGGKQSAALQQLAASVGGEDAAAQREILGHIERMTARKRALFPHDKRTVVAWKVWFQGRQMQVSAAAAGAAP